MSYIDVLPNEISSLDAGRSFCFHIEGQWPGASDFLRSATTKMVNMQRPFESASRSLSVAMWLLIAFVATGCIPQHHHFTYTRTEKLILRSGNPEQYSIRIPHNSDYPVPPDGHRTLNYRVTDGYWEARFMDANFAGTSLCDTTSVKAIYIVKGSTVVKKITLKQLGKCPVDEHGYRIIELN